MINAIEYIVTVDGVPRALKANKAVTERGGWHLSTIGGNGLPDTTALGNPSHGLAGQSYTGISIAARTISVKLYCDGFSGANMQQMLEDAQRAVSVGNDALGYLVLINAFDERKRIRAKCVGMEIEQQRIKTALVRFDFSCPYAWFEDDIPHIVQVVAAQGGKIYPLERPYDFANYEDVTDVSSSVYRGFTVVNTSDMPVPFGLHIYGAGITKVVLTVNGKSITVEGDPLANGVYISTDADELGAFLTDGTRADEYITISSARLSDMKLKAGSNSVSVSIFCTSVTVSGTNLEWRGRYSACL